MIVTVVCCFSVVCTAVLATYGIAADPPCLAFSLSYASLSILVSALYYIIVKVSLAAMGAVLDASSGKRQKPEPVFAIFNRHKFNSLPPQENEESSRVPESDEIQYDEEDAGSPWSFSSASSSCSVDDDELAHDHDNDESDEVQDGQQKTVNIVTSKLGEERYSTLKIWTNVYGLAVGVFCIVHSLLLASELSNSIFCFCLWAESMRELFSMCKKKHGNHVGVIQQRRRWSRCIRFFRHVQCCEPPSGKMFPCLCFMLLAGIVLKIAGSILSLSPRMNVPGESVQVACSIVIPIAGVVSIRSMRKIDNIQATMELSAPICWLGSILCFMIILLCTDGNSCILKHLYYEDEVDFAMESSRNVSDNGRLAWATTASASLRHQPLLSVLVMPFPLICAVVAVVSCSQSEHIMVSFFDCVFFGFLALD